MSQDTAITDYDEALMVIAGSSMILPEKRHLMALYQRIWKLEQLRQAIAALATDNPLQEPHVIQQRARE